MAPPQGHGQMGAIHAAQREPGRVGGVVGAREPPAAGEDGGAAGAGDRPPSAPRPGLSVGLAALLAAALALEGAVAPRSLAAIQEDAVGG